MPRVIHLKVAVNTTGNIQATHSASIDNSRSESAVVANPTNPMNLLAGSKKFSNPHKYEFTLATAYSFDNGATWAESAPLALLADQFGVTWGGISDPALAWDDQGSAYLVALPFAPNDGPTLGIAIYKSTDGGQSWGTPVVIHSGDDDKQWIAGDTSPTSPHRGNVYAVWDNGRSARLQFARSTDHGASWRGWGTKTINDSVLALDAFSPEISLAPDGTIYIAWWNRYSNHTATSRRVMLVRSTDGGETFTTPITVADGITDLEAVFPKTGNWAHFPGAKFRLVTCVTCCAVDNDTVLVAWADAREKVNGAPVARVYYSRSTDKGNTWAGSSSGERLLGTGLNPGQFAHDFHPQIVATPTGVVGCAWYQFHVSQPQQTGGDIDVHFAPSYDGGHSFDISTTVTDRPWDPAVGAPWSHGDSNVTFIGEYFGLDANADGFHVVWTDTRTGMQELFYSRLQIEDRYHLVGAEIGGVVVGGVAVDGGGFIILPGGHVIPVPPRGPLVELATHLGQLSLAAEVGNKTDAEIVSMQRDALNGLVRAAEVELKRLAGP